MVHKRGLGTKSTATVKPVADAYLDKFHARSRAKKQQQQSVVTPALQKPAYEPEVKRNWVNHRIPNSLAVHRDAWPNSRRFVVSEDEFAVAAILLSHLQGSLPKNTRSPRR